MPCRLSVVATSAEIDGTRASFFEDMLDYIVDLWSTNQSANIRVEILISRLHNSQ